MNHLERMKARIYISVATAILASPGLALAGTVTVSYTGTVASVQGDGFGYTNGDAISGWFTYDDDFWVDCSSGTGVCQQNNGDVDSNTGDGGLSNSGALDYVYECALANNCTTFNDYFLVRDGSTSDYSYFNWYDTDGDGVNDAFDGGQEAWYHQLVDYDITQTNGTTTQQSYVQLVSQRYDYVCTSYDSQTGCASNDYTFTFDYNNQAFANNLTYSLPEPGTLGLLGLGLLGMAARRKKKV